MAGRVTLVILLLFLAACGESRSTAPEPGPAAQSEEVATSAEAIAFGEALAQIRGHHLVSLMLYRAGDDKGRPYMRVIRLRRSWRQFELSRTSTAARWAGTWPTCYRGASAIADRKAPGSLPAPIKRPRP